MKSLILFFAVNLVVFSAEAKTKTACELIAEVQCQDCRAGSYWTCERSSGNQGSYEGHALSESSLDRVEVVYFNSATQTRDTLVFKKPSLNLGEFLPSRLQANKLVRKELKDRGLPLSEFIVLDLDFIILSGPFTLYQDATASAPVPYPTGW